MKIHPERYFRETEEQETFVTTGRSRVRILVRILSIMTFPSLPPGTAVREAENCPFTLKVKVKQSRYMPWRRLGGEEI
jgi:hypothetical protein